MHAHEIRSTPLATWVLALVLAGCSGTPPIHAVGATVAAPEAPQAFFSSGEGGVQGTVVDDSLLPIADATLSLFPVTAGADALASTTASGEGAFAFSYLQPADYRLATTAPGRANQTMMVKVETEKVTTVSVIMSDVPSQEPYPLLTIKNRIQTCAHSVDGTTLNSVVAFRNACNMVSPGNISYVNAEMALGHRAAVVEFNWQERNVAGIWNIYAIDSKKKTTQLLATSDAPKAPEFPAVRMQLLSGQLAQDYTSTVGTTKTVAVPPSDQPFVLSSGVVYGGEDHQGVRVGFQVQWRYTVYVTVFMNGVPPGLDEYSAIPDA